MPKLEVCKEGDGLRTANVAVCFEADIGCRPPWQQNTHDVLGNDVQSRHLFDQKSIPNFSFIPLIFGYIYTDGFSKEKMQPISGNKPLNRFPLLKTI